MTHEEPHDHNATVRGHNEMQLKLIGFLLAVSLSILGWGFNNWSNAVDSGMTQVMDKLNRIEARNEKRDEHLSMMQQEVRVINERQLMMKEQLEKFRQGQVP